MHRITPFIVMDILAKARSIPNAVHMEVGEPDLSPPPAVVEAFARAAKDNRFFYTPACGLPELREKIAQHYLDAYDVKISPARIIITSGTSGAFLIALSLFAGQKKGLVLSDPSYPCYKNFSYFLNIEPCFVTAGRETNFEITPEAMMEFANAGAVMVSSPANPTGSIYGAESMRRLVNCCDEKGMWFISDEIYHGLVYDEKEHTALEFSDNAIVINSFSKYFCMPGIRVGWMILPEHLVRPAEILIQNLFISANTPAQYAALEAFDYGHLASVRKIFRERRDILCSELEDLVHIVARPQGAFYIWADISRYSNDAFKFCGDLLDAHGVAITPGIDFGSSWTDHVRFAYTRDVAELREGVRRIRQFLSR
jgi:aspartate/methionine/tyrosine aminotransferase